MSGTYSTVGYMNTDLGPIRFTGVLRLQGCMVYMVYIWGYIVGGMGMSVNEMSGCLPGSWKSMLTSRKSSQWAKGHQ